MSYPQVNASAGEKLRFVQFGCGWSAPAGWTNFDASPTLRYERIPLLGKFYTRNRLRFPPNVRYGDIVRGLPLSPSSCDAIYCSHVLEHLARDDLRTSLRNTSGLLKPKGVFRLVVPDLEFYVMRYNADMSAEACERFLVETGLGVISRNRGLRGLLRTHLNENSLTPVSVASAAHHMVTPLRQNSQRSKLLTDGKTA
jgi:SAM-dependent methyltransferase